MEESNFSWKYDAFLKFQKLLVFLNKKNGLTFYNESITFMNFTDFTRNSNTDSERAAFFGRVLIRSQIQLLFFIKLNVKYFLSPP